MTKTELIQKLEDIEWEDFEVKEARKNIPKNIWETVSAFANTAGGWIILGVKQTPNGYELTGVDNPEKLESDFLTVLRGEKFNVKLRAFPKKYKIDDKKILAFYISLSDKKPIYFNNRKNCFIRTGSGDQRATDEEIDSMYRDSAFGTRSEKTVENSSFDWLHTPTIERYRDYLSRFNPDHIYNRARSDEFLMKSLLSGKNSILQNS